MSATVIVSGVLEGLQLVEALASMLAQASAAIATAQNSGQPVDFTAVLGEEAIAESNVLSAIAVAKAAGK